MAEYYLPGFKGGGPIRTLANLCALLARDAEFAIVTRDRDLGADTSYPDIRVNEWQRVEEALVYYADPKSFGLKAFREAFRARDFDIVYLNSFFSYRASISILANSLFSRRFSRKILVAPRGEFSVGALSIKSIKKRSFLWVAKLLGIYGNVHWHASTALEAEDIRRVFPHIKNKIYLAVDPVSSAGFSENFGTREKKRTGLLKISFVSRISPMKNLDGLIHILANVGGNVQLDIYGPIEDETYWQHCQAAILSLPSNIEAIYRGALAPDDVPAAFAGSDLFAFPTHGENFGHVVFEALRVGTPVLISDQTPWQGAASGAITVAPLTAPDIWRAHIEAAIGWNAEQQQSLRRASVEYARAYAQSGQARSDNLRMFLDVADRKHEKDS